MGFRDLLRTIASPVWGRTTRTSRREAALGQQARAAARQQARKKQARWPQNMAAENARMEERSRRAGSDPGVAEMEPAEENPTAQIGFTPGWRMRGFGAGDVAEPMSQQQQQQQQEQPQSQPGWGNDPTKPFGTP